MPDYKSTLPLFLAGKRLATAKTIDVIDPFDDSLFARVCAADEALVERALQAATAARGSLRALAAFERKGVLDRAARRIAERKEEFAESIRRESGKGITAARAEVDRSVETFTASAEEAVRLEGTLQPLDTLPSAQHYFALKKPLPIGVAALITPFNFPLNLVAHKVGPAIAAGCPFILKPASKTPVTALLLGDVLIEAGMPEGGFSILPCPGALAEKIACDARVAVVSFTGSATVGRALKGKAVRQRIVLELGGNAPVVVDAGADWKPAVRKITLGAFNQAGQSCISVQRILIHESIYAPVRDALVEEAKKLPFGDPKDEATVVGPMITGGDAERLDKWIRSAVDHGARRLCGGEREGNVVTPALLENVPHSEALWAQEAFGPVAVLESFSDFEGALAKANESEFGLQAGVFTRDYRHALRAWEVLEVGGVLIDEVPTWRADRMPYGGVKASGFGREGVRDAVETFTEKRLLIMQTPGA